VILKPCPDCGVTKPLEDFPPAKRRSDGTSTYCKSCMTVRSRASYRKRMAADGRVVREREALAEGHRRCPDCEQVKPLEDFPRNVRGREGRGTYCKPCHNHRTRETSQRLYGGGRSYHLKARYGITAAEYDAMVEAQGGLCPLCRERPPEHVDHDHVTGAIRGVLCSCCNQGLGNFRDSVAFLRAAVDYLERTTWQRQRVQAGVYRLTSPRPAPAPSPSSSELQRLICSQRA
jgi:hypothetical protein